MMTHGLHHIKSSDRDSPSCLAALRGGFKKTERLSPEMMTRSKRGERREEREEGTQWAQRTLGGPAKERSERRG